MVETSAEKDPSSPSLGADAAKLVELIEDRLPFRETVGKVLSILPKEQLL